MKKNQLVFAGIFFIALIVFVFWFGLFAPRAPQSSQKIVFIAQKGEGSTEIASNLEHQGLIRSALLFKTWAFMFQFSHTLQAGAYELSPAMSALQIGKKLASGDVMKEFITIPEGWDLARIAEMLQSQGRFKMQDFLQIAQEDFSKKFGILSDKPAQASLEGYLFPDTYQITRAETLQDLVEQMLANFTAHFTQDLRNETLRQKKTVFQIVTMASLIEKEVQTTQDKKIVSGILWKRMQYGIPLQVDSSLETYKHRGLPLGPIANAGLESILAALYPIPSPYLYYLSTKTGETIFSKTLDEHNAAKAKYLK